MYKNIISFIVLIHILTGCFSTSSKSGENPVKSGKEGTTVFINLPKTGQDKLNVSEFADTVLYVPLETNSQSLFRGIC